MREETGLLPEPLPPEANTENSPVETWAVAGYPAEFHVRTLGFEGTPRQGLAMSRRSIGRPDRNRVD